MPSLFQWLQIAFAVLVLAVIVERAITLLWRLPASDAAVRWLSERIRQSDLAAAQAYAEQRAETLIGRIVLAHVRAEPGDASDDVEGCLAELSHAATQRLLALRVFATMASTLGLLGGVLALRRGMGAGPGLVGLEAGLAERLALAEALVTMALGVATAAVSFHALAAFRRAARNVIAQGRSIAHLLEQREPRARRPDDG